MSGSEYLLWSYGQFEKMTFFPPDPLLTICGFFLRWWGTLPQHCDHSIWDCVGFYMKHIFLTCWLRAISNHFKHLNKAHNFQIGKLFKHASFTHLGSTTLLFSYLSLEKHSRQRYSSSLLTASMADCSPPPQLACFTKGKAKAKNDGIMQVTFGLNCDARGCNTHLPR